MPSLQNKTKKIQFDIFQTNVSIPNLLRTQGIQIRNTVMDSSLQTQEYDPLSDANSWRINPSIPSYSTSKRKAIDPELQKLSQKVMKRIWDNKEDEFWDSY